MKTNTILQSITLLVCCMLSGVIVIAQTAPPPKQWDKRFGGTNVESLYSLLQTIDGGYILGGYSASGISGDKTESSRGLWDYWVVKIDANGIKQWDKRFGGNSYEQLLSLQQTTDGGYILGGFSASGISGDKTQASRGLNDYWVVKIDDNGIKQWDKRFGGSDYEDLRSLQQTADGGYILGGDSRSGIGGDKTQDSRGNYDYWVVKIDGNGVKQWDKCFGGTEYDILSSLQQTTDGGYILGGYSLSGISGDKTENTRGGEDYWIVKVDANGVKQWDKRFGGATDDYLFSLQQTTEGGYILGGHSLSGISGDKSEDSRGGEDFWIIKIDANGVKQWDKRFGGTENDELKSFQQTTDGGYILGGGSLSGISGDKTENNRGSWDDWVVKTDANGIKQWDKRFGGNYQDYLSSLQQTTDGGYIVGGGSSSGISGDKTENSRGNEDYWVVKIGCPPAASVKAMGNLDICATGSVILKVNATDTLKYQWLRNGEKINGATKGYYKATVAGRYNAVVYSDTDCRNISNPLKVTSSCITNANTETAVGAAKPAIENLLSPSPFERVGVRLYPNPSNDNITITYNSSISGTVQLNIFDITGKKLFTKTMQAVAGNNVLQLDLSMLTAGVYNLQMVNGIVKTETRFLIEK